MAGSARSIWVRSVLTSLALGATLGGIAAVAVPTGLLPRARRDAGEAAAVSILQNLVSAEQVFADLRAIDADGDGRGEFGFLGELAGSARLRLDGDGAVGAATLAPPLLPLPFARLTEGCAARAGYLFAVFLPGPDGAPCGEAPDGGGAGARIDPDAAERGFFACAWPLAAGRAKRAFCIDQDGRLLAADNEDFRYCGLEHRVPAGAPRGGRHLWRPWR